MKLNNRFIFGLLSLILAAVVAFVALPTICLLYTSSERVKGGITDYLRSEK